MARLDHEWKQQIALLAGGDLDEQTAREVRRRVACCAESRRHWLRLRGALDALHSVDSQHLEQELHSATAPSLWNSLQHQLGPVVLAPKSPNRPAWIPAFSLTAACLALLAVTQWDHLSRSRFESWPRSGEFQSASFLPAGPPQMIYSSHTNASGSIRSAFPFQDWQSSVDLGEDQLAKEGVWGWPPAEDSPWVAPPMR